MAARISRLNAVTVNEVLDGQKALEIDCPDRIYLTLSVPNLMVGGQVVSFLTQHEGKPVPSPALLDRRGQTFRQAVESFAHANHIPVINFAGKKDKNRPGALADSPWPQRKIDQVMPLMRKAAATGRSQVVAIGVAQEYQLFRPRNNWYLHAAPELLALAAARLHEHNTGSRQEASGQGNRLHRRVGLPDGGHHRRPPARPAHSCGGRRRVPR